MPRVLAALALVPALATAPALAEKAATGATVPKPASMQVDRASTLKPTSEAAMLKAQKEAAARDKAWDNRTRASMTSICKGC